MVDLSLNPTIKANDVNFFAIISRTLQKLNDQIQITTFSDKEQQQDSSIIQKKIDHICQVVDICCKLFLSLSELCDQQISIQEQTCLFSIIKMIPSSVESIVNLLKCKEVADSSDAAIARAKIAQILMHLICKYFHSNFISNERCFKLILDNIDKPEFIIRFDENINFDRELSKFLSKQICSEQQMHLIVEALQRAYALKRNSIIENLSRQGMLQFIGYPKNKHITDQIQELSEIMPHLTKPQLHLCLRHFGYDLEKTLEGLCERDQLPFDLKILLRTKDELENANHRGRKKRMTNDEKLFNICENAPHLDGKDVDCKLEKIEELISKLAIDEATVKLGGKELVRLGTQKEGIVTAEQRSALIAATTRRADQMEGNEEEELAISDEEVEQRLELKMAAEVGQSGRFNRLSQLADNIYDDEYDDTYEHAQLYTKVDLGADTVDEKEIEFGNLMNSEEGSSQSCGQQNNQQQKGQNPPRRNYAHPQKGGTIVKNAQELKKEIHPKKNEEKPSSSAKNNTMATQQQRRTKEQNKGKERQKGADRKMKGSSQI